VHNFLDEEEVEALTSFAQSEENPYSLRPSTTGHKSWTEGGEGNVNSQRTSENGFDISSPTAIAVKRRAFELARLDGYDERLADGIQILRYKEQQAYVPHKDYFELRTSDDHNWDPRTGGSNRFATVFLYLSDVEEGGQTVFPRIPGSNSTAPLPREASILAAGTWEQQMTEACYSKFSVTPRLGDALLFYSQQPDGSLDPLSLHGGCPVLSGTKWAANVWIWNSCRYGVCVNQPPK